MTNLLLDKIEYITENGAKSQNEYIYDKSSQLDSINRTANGVLIYSNRFSYDIQKRLIEKQWLSMIKGTLKKQSIDSFIYDSKNRIVEVKYYYSDTFNVFSLYQITKYTYNKSNFLETTTHLSRNFQDTVNNVVNEITRISKYYWNNNNLVRQEDFSQNMTLLHEWTFQYDKKSNSSLKITPLFSPYKLQNTLISSTVIDYTGLLDRFVPSKITKLCYNTEGFLTKITREKGEENYIYRNP